MKKSRSSLRAFSILTASIAVLLGSRSAQAASSNWSVDAGGSWTTTGNWDNGIPGIAGGTNSTDVATFGFPLTLDRLVTVDANRNIGGITFSNTSAFKYTLGTGPIKLSSGGVIQTASGNGDHTDTITSTIAIQGDGGSATFRADATSANSVLSITGGVTGVSTAANTTTLTLTGVNTGANVISGIISNGGVGKTAIVKSGLGSWTLSGNNTFTGGVTVNAGVLRATTNANALGAGTLSLGGGELQLANASGTNLSFNRNTTVTADSQITSDVTAAGNGDTFTLGTLSIGAQTLTVAGGANVTGGTAGVTFGAATLVGNATFNVTNPAGGGATVLTFSNVVTGGTNSFTKSGSGTVSFGGTTNANTYTGLTTVSGGELQLNKTSGTNAIAGNATVGNGTLRLVQGNQIADTSTVSLIEGGTLAFAAGAAETLAGLTLTSSGAVATLDLGVSGKLLLTGATPTLTFGPNTRLNDSGTITAPVSINANTPANPMTLNFDGGTVSSGQISIGSASAINTTTNINITQTLGGNGAVFIVGGSGNQKPGTTALNLNLNNTGVIDLGATFLAYSNGSGGQPTTLNVTVANTATGLSGGVASVMLQANAASPLALPAPLYNTQPNTLTFATGFTQPFTLSGGVIDVRSGSTTSGQGSITTNGRSLIISGGSLIGNIMPSTTGAITLSAGNLALRNTGGTVTNYLISTTDGNDGRTIKMLSGNTGTFTVSSVNIAGNKILIGSALTNGGTWDRGTINAGSNYTINDSAGNAAFSSTLAAYTIADNSGLNGLAMGANAIPTLLTLGANSSFFAATSTAAARTYNVGVAGTSSFR